MLHDPADADILAEIGRCDTWWVEANGWPRAKLLRAHRMVRSGLLQRQEQRGRQRGDGPYRFWMFHLTEAGSAALGTTETT